jgi:four helix bundle protein
MATARRFEDLFAWQLAMELCQVIFEITETGPAAYDDEFQKQIRKAAKRAPPLIAEGFLRFLPRPFVNYLRMARGEIGEVQSDLKKGERCKYFTEAQLARAVPLANRTMAVTTRLLLSKIRQLENEKEKGSKKNDKRKDAR